MPTKNSTERLDPDWKKLMIEAKNLGIQKEEVRQFLRKHGTKALISERS